MDKKGGLIQPPFLKANEINPMTTYLVRTRFFDSMNLKPICPIIIKAVENIAIPVKFHVSTNGAAVETYYLVL